MLEVMQYLRDNGFKTYTAGAASGALTDVGINDHLMKELAAAMTPGSSTLFVLVRKATPDKVLEELKGNRRPGLEDLALPRGRN